MDAGLGDFYHATQSKAYTSVDTSKGRVTLVDGTFYFSPNCSRDIHSHPDKAKSLPSTVNSATVPVEYMHRPRWWSQEFAHLAFLETSSVETSGFGWALHNQPSYKKGKDGWYYSDPQSILHMNRLQHDLRKAANALLSLAGAPTTPEVIDNALHCTTRSRDSADVRRDNRRSREWFAYWLCRLSYAIAVLDSINFTKGVEHGVDPNVEWFRYMADNSWHQAFLASVQTSCTNYSIFSKRVGIILNLDDPLLNQFSVHWFCRYNVPVWFPYTPRTNRLRGISAYVESVCPTAEQLQAATPLVVHKTLPTTPDSPEGQSKFLPVPLVGSPERWAQGFPGRPATPSPTLDRDQRITLPSPPAQPRYDPSTQDDETYHDVDAMDTGADVEVVRDPTPAAIIVQPYVQFFEQTEKRNRQLEESETEEDKKRRLQRAASGGLSKAKVYVWRRNDEDAAMVARIIHETLSTDYNRSYIRPVS
ncbi:hypothetical protein CPC08DRAFT_761074 [Agrocybe pediades]|nr:hypothetical protein CPC08DRAFT_761074 [Agrocybe pediades]